MLENYHTHTPRCKHAVGAEREYIERAISKGFKVLGFSDHVPQPYPEDFVSRVRMDMKQLPEYIQTLLSLREEYKDKIDILIGFEVEYIEETFDKLMNELRKYPVDYLIQGQHFVPNEMTGFYSGVPTESEEILKMYVEHTIKGMKTGVFSYLAHPDIINFHGDEEVYRQNMCRIIETAVELDLPLEVNMLGFVDNRGYPSERFFKMASEMGAKFVIGCDAHKPEAVVQPEEVSGLCDFMKKNGIIVKSNQVKLRKI